MEKRDTWLITAWYQPVGTAPGDGVGSGAPLGLTQYEYEGTLTEAEQMMSVLERHMLDLMDTSGLYRGLRLAGSGRALTRRDYSAVLTIRSASSAAARSAMERVAAQQRRRSRLNGSGGF